MSHKAQQCTGIGRGNFVCRKPLPWFKALNTGTTKCQRFKLATGWGNI
jgi:hypothetical protein